MAGFGQPAWGQPQPEPAFGASTSIGFGASPLGASAATGGFGASTDAGLSKPAFGGGAQPAAPVATPAAMKDNLGPTLVEFGGSDAALWNMPW